ncbi:MAG: hypothetical protein ACR2MX_07505 [Cyclobacteriaceae bacterium]
MTDTEYDILDELYFVISFGDLQDALGMEGKLLKPELEKLVEKKWVKCFSSVSNELAEEAVDFERNYQNYHYLASKEGLLKHNSR